MKHGLLRLGQSQECRAVQDHVQVLDSDLLASRHGIEVPSSGFEEGWVSAEGKFKIADPGAGAVLDTQFPDEGHSILEIG